VAVGHALATAAGAPFRRDEGPLLAVACQRAEGEFVGMPCGIMDPYVIACAHEGTALLLDCARLRAELVPLPDDLALIVLDTGVRRALRDGRYQERVEECEAAREAAQVALDRPLGQLAELRPGDLARLEAELDPHLFRRTRHVVGENERVTRAVEALRGSDLERAGRELYASHDSLAGDYEVSWLEADAVVAASRDIGAVLGARMTGAGWGGCTLHLVRSGDAEATQAALHDAFATRFGAEPRSWCMRPGPAAHGI
jgi:galactokinase